MAFRMDDIIEVTDSGKIRGIQREIACACWFTSSGKLIPYMIKVMDEEGIIHAIHEIKVLCSEEKRFSGIETVEHICKLPLGEREETVKLIFTKGSCKWTIVHL